MQHLKIAIIQADLVWKDAAQNRINFSSKINKIKEQVDLILLPEMFSTGFSIEPKAIAETMEGETVMWMKKVASENKCAIGGSLIISEGDLFFNRFLFVSPSGEVEYYNKRHLFSLAGEDEIYTQGTEKLIVNYKGWKICPLVCYDLRFPVWSRNIEDYDVLLYVANWPKQRVLAWDTLLKARSIENLCYTVGVNRVGLDANKFAYSGHSSAYDCLGKQIAETKENEEDIAVFTLSKEALHKVRTTLNFLNDKDSFKILD